MDAAAHTAWSVRRSTVRRGGQHEGVTRGVRSTRGARALAASQKSGNVSGPLPSPTDPGDTGWHVDASFGTEDPDFLSWRVNVTSKGRALLMLFLFSDVGPDDAPTRIRVGSHLEIARVLARAGDEGLSLRELVASGVLETAGSREALATGDAGTVYLCHPFLVHAAQPHRGAHPRFMAQPPLLPAEPLALIRADGEYSPVEQAIRRALTVG
jgi:phytanoyl-CoA dioxygenase PhyH